MLRARRLELGISKRELSDNCGVTSTVISRLEETGEVASFTVETLMKILQCLSLDLNDLTNQPESPNHETKIFDVRELGQLLHNFGKAMSRSNIAQCLGLSLEAVDTAAKELDELLKLTGLQIQYANRGLRIIARAASPHLSKATDTALRARNLEVLNAGDISLLYQIMKGGLDSKNVSGRNNGNVSLYKLENANLVRTEKGGRLFITDRALKALGCEDDSKH